MDKVAAYFDERAAGWDEMETHTASPVQGAVAAMAGVHVGSRVADLGCGLGVMVPVYLEAGAGYVLGVDISSQMVERARKKRGVPGRVEFVACDAADLSPDAPFDAAVIYNAYPHFMDRPALVQAVHQLLAPGGRFVVAHGTGRGHINAHHEAKAAGVSLGLRPVHEEAKAWEGLFQIDVLADAPDFFAFAGSRR